MTVLITNIWLKYPAGTEVYVRDLAIELQGRGIHVMVYSPQLGQIAEQIREHGIFVTDKIEAIYCTPDIIHGHHTTPTLEAIIQFPNVPVIYFIHDRTYAGDTPVKHAQVVQYLASDYNTLNRLVIDEGIELAHTAVMLNWVDTSKFKPRTPLPSSPKRALVFSNYAADNNYLPAIVAACTKKGIELDIVGMTAGSATIEPEKILGNYDIIFAKGKAAIESIAVGAAVIPCDYRGLGELVNTKNYEHQRKYNFGMLILNRPIETELIVAELEKYDPKEANFVSLRIREEADIKKYTNELLQHYNRAIHQFKNDHLIHQHQTELTIQFSDGPNKILWQHISEMEYTINQLLTQQLIKEKTENKLLKRRIEKLMHPPFHAQKLMLRNGFHFLKKKLGIKDS